MDRLFPCPVCDRVFGSFNALSQHRRDSRSHLDCLQDGCHFQSLYFGDLMRHADDTSHMWACRGCDDGHGEVFMPESREWYDHVNEFHVCVPCEEHFHDEWELSYHRYRDHDETSDAENDGSDDDDSNSNNNAIARRIEHECLGCTRSFEKISSMMQHLESGACDSQVDSYDVNYYAALYRSWSLYLRRNSVSDACFKRPLWGQDAFFCPDCDWQFERLSALLQHVEGPICDATVNYGVLRDLLDFMEGKIQNEN